MYRPLASSSVAYPDVSSTYPASMVKELNRFRALDEDLKQFYVGPIVPKDFLATYFPGERDTNMPSFSGTHRKAFTQLCPLSQKTPKNRWKRKGRGNGKGNRRKTSEEQGVQEAELYAPFVKAIGPYCPNFQIAITGHHDEKESAAHLAGDKRPGITLYPNDLTSRQAADILASELGIEMKLDEASDPFDDNSGSTSFIRASEEAQLTRGQLASYAGAQLASQFRTHCFSVWATGTSARILRWDRGGVVFTEKFNFTKEPWLVNFLWKLNHADAATRGHDESVTIAGEEDADHVKRAREVLALAADATVYKIAVKDEKTNRWSYYYGGSLARKSSVSPVGRCTRGFEVIDEDGNRVFLKDTWRIHGSNYPQESDLYDLLAGSRHIPTILVAGDVTGAWQKTVSHEWLEEGHRANLRVYQHYLIVLKEVGIPLIRFEDTRQLVTAMRDALEAYSDAYDKNILHRDISIGNILIDPTKGGLLIDWEFAKCIDKAGTRIMERTGTWQFISVHLLSSPPGSAEHTMIDDLESFFHVLCYLVLVRCEHGLEPDDLQLHLDNVYHDSWQQADGTMKKDKVIGGWAKERALAGKFMEHEANLPPGPLRDLIVTIESLFATRYDIGPSEEERLNFEEMVARVNPTPKYLEMLRPLVWVYDEKMKILNSPSPQWMLDLFNKALEDPRGLNGKPVRRSFLTTSHNRVQETTHIMSDHVVARDPAVLKRKRGKVEKEAPRASRRRKTRRQ